MFAEYSQSQDKKADTTVYPPFDRNKIQDPYLLDGTSDTISYNKYIWHDKRTISEVLNEESGFYIIDFGVGSRDLIYHNNISDDRLGFFKDGIEVNDIYFGGLDVENFSINEISKIELVSNVSSFLYGLNNYGKSINIISKDDFRSKAFCQLRYSQDRNNSLNADINFILPISDKINITLGVNNNGNEGRYMDSSNIWRGRARMNFIISPKLNVKINFNYAQIHRNLNGGLISASIDTLTDPIVAREVNINSYEKIRNYFYDVDLTAKLFNSNKSLTKLKLYSINSVRLYRDDQSGPNPPGPSIAYNFRYIQYGIDLKQNYSTQLNENNSFNFIFGYNGYFNLYDNSINGTFQNTYHSFLSKMDIFSKNIYISVFGRYNHIDDNYLNYGVETKYYYLNLKDFSAGFKGGINKTSVPINIIPDNSGKINNRYIEIGTTFKISSINFDLLYFNNQRNIYNTDNNDGINFASSFQSKNFDYCFSIDKFNEIYFPGYFLKTDISYHDYFFNNKLNLRFGFNVKYGNNIEPITYNQIFYMPGNRIDLQVYYFNLDFYIGARIGSANINFTLGNLFNTFNYLAYLYPLTDRGGAFQVISRFTVVWDFLN